MDGHIFVVLMSLTDTKSHTCLAYSAKYPPPKIRGKTNCTYESYTSVPV